MTSRSPLLMLFCSLLLQCCNNPSKQPGLSATPKDTSKRTENKIMTPAMVCYAGVLGKDSIFLKTEIFSNVVTGNLVYRFYEKDSNEGEINGTLKNDTLLADYNFMSEGKLSVRQVTFIITDSTASEGYGPVEEKNGKMVFKSSKGIIFRKGFVLKKVPCPL